MFLCIACIQIKVICFNILFCSLFVLFTGWKSALGRILSAPRLRAARWRTISSCSSLSRSNKKIQKTKLQIQNRKLKIQNTRAAKWRTISSCNTLLSAQIRKYENTKEHTYKCKRWHDVILQKDLVLQQNSLVQRNGSEFFLILGYFRHFSTKYPLVFGKI